MSDGIVGAIAISLFGTSCQTVSVCDRWLFIHKDSFQAARRNVELVWMLVIPSIAISNLAECMTNIPTSFQKQYKSDAKVVRLQYESAVKVVWKRCENGAEVVQKRYKDDTEVVRKRYEEDRRNDALTVRKRCGYD